MHSGQNRKKENRVASVFILSFRHSGRALAVPSTAKKEEKDLTADGHGLTQMEYRQGRGRHLNDRMNTYARQLKDFVAGDAEG